MSLSAYEACIDQYYLLDRYKIVLVNYRSPSWLYLSQNILLICDVFKLQMESKYCYVIFNGNP